MATSLRLMRSMKHGATTTFSLRAYIWLLDGKCDLNSDQHAAFEDFFPSPTRCALWGKVKDVRVLAVPCIRDRGSGFRPGEK